MRHKLKITLFIGLLLVLFSACQNDDLHKNQTEQAQETIKVSADELLKLLKDTDIKNAILQNTSIKKSNDGLSLGYFEKLDFKDFDNYSLFFNDYSAETPYYRSMVITIDNNNVENAFFVLYTPTEEGYDGSDPFNIKKFVGRMEMTDLEGNPIISFQMEQGVVTAVYDDSEPDCETSISITIVPCSHGDGHLPGETCTGGLINDAYYLVDINVRCKPRYLYAAGTTTGGGGTGGGGVANTPEVIFENYYLSQEQRDFLDMNPDIDAAIHAYLNKIGYASGTGYAVNLIKEMMATGLTFDVERSHKSPVYIDITSVSGNSPEEVRFRQVYDKLTKSPLFKKLFVNLFGTTNFINTQFKIANIPQNNPNATKHGSCQLFSSTDGVLKNEIVLNRSSLLEQSDVVIAQVIIHECIHAFLNIKLRHPSIGMQVSDINDMDFTECINTFYSGFSGNQTQHQFFIDYMAPVIANILTESKPYLFTQEQIVKAEYPENPGGVYVYVPSNTIPRGPSTQQMPWNWNDYFRYLSMDGLQYAESFDSIYPPDSVERYYFDNYRAAGIIMFAP